MTQTISTIVDMQPLSRWVIQGLYDPNNFYYCRYWLMFYCFDIVYMTQTISTIVDTNPFHSILLRLYDPNNFYYCRYYNRKPCYFNCLYDPNNFYYCRLIDQMNRCFWVYMTQTISTIVDSINSSVKSNRLYDPNNFYYCRLWVQIAPVAKSI